MKNFFKLQNVPFYPCLSSSFLNVLHNCNSDLYGLQPICLDDLSDARDQRQNLSNNLSSKDCYSFELNNKVSILTGSDLQQDADIRYM